MKRENFEIRNLNTNQTTIKHTWNASIKEIVKQVSMIAENDNCVYNRIAFQFEKEGYDFLSGSQIWQASNQSANSVTFKITKLTDNEGRRVDHN